LAAAEHDTIAADKRKSSLESLKTVGHDACNRLKIKQLGQLSNSWPCCLQQIEDQAAWTA